jgi:outer membrane protein OmpA-like peptidoglycan-associated protein
MESNEPRRDRSFVSRGGSASAHVKRPVLVLLLSATCGAMLIGCSRHASPKPASDGPRGDDAAKAMLSRVKPPEEELVGPPLPPPAEEELVGPPVPSPEMVVASAPPPEPPAATTTRTERLIAQLERKGISASQSTRGVVIVLPESVFEFGTDELPRESKRRLHDVADAITTEANSSRVSVEGHTDSTGADLYNRGLSERRAKAVALELEGAGVGESRIESVGYGAMYPIAANQRADGSDDPAGRARNRRVEIVIETAMPLVR